MNLSKLFARSPQQIEILRKFVSMHKDREHYILNVGMLRWGGSMFIVTTLGDWHHEFGWHVPAVRPALFLYFLYILFNLILWTVGGYYFGASLWKKAFGETTQRMPAQTSASSVFSVLKSGFYSRDSAKRSPPC
jgi:hypothetical protein